MSHSEITDTPSIGRRLRQAREARGASTLEAATALHLPLNIIESLEAERFQQLGAAVYVRGHLRSYLRWLQLPEVLLDSALKQVDAAPPALRSATHVPHLRYLADRYAVRAVYVLLTLSIIVPALWVATEHANLGSPRETARSLDQSPLPLAPETTSAQPLVDAVAAVPLVPPGAPPMASAPQQAELPEQTVIASLTPFYTPDLRPAAPAVPAEMASEPAETGDTLQFRFDADSWVEIVDSQGQRLEYGIVPAGAERRYPVGAIARVALGNATAVQIQRDGEAVDFERFRRANVARFAVSSAGELRPLGE